jgi:uncharacterized protein YjbJ (UPF0337 family)
MKWDQIQGDWKLLTGKVREKWGRLTDDDLIGIAGKRDRFSGLLQERYGYAREQSDREIEKFTKSLTPNDSEAQL